MRRYLKYSSNLANPGADKWFVQHEFKSSCEIPRRLSVNWMTNNTGVPFYRLRMEQQNNCNVTDPDDPVLGFPEQICFPAQAGASCPDFRQLAGQWFYDEYFVKYSAGGSSSDRVGYVINGKKIFYHEGPVKTAKPKGIKLTPGPCGPPSHY